MPTFDAADVADQTALFAEALNDTAAVLRVTYAVAAGGGRTETWATASTVAARWARARGAATENATAGGVWARSQTPVKLAAGTDVQERDRLQRGLPMARSGTCGAWMCGLMASWWTRKR
jgi:hypothetical protein